MVILEIVHVAAVWNPAAGQGQGGGGGEREGALGEGSATDHRGQRPEEKEN